MHATPAPSSRRALASLLRCAAGNRPSHGFLGPALAAALAAMGAGTPAFASQQLESQQQSQASAVPDPLELRRDPESDPMFGRPIVEVQLLEAERDRPDVFGPIRPRLARVATNQIRTLAGAPYDPRDAQEDVQRLSRLPQFGRVAVEVVEQGSGVAVVFRVVSQPVIEAAEVVGNRVLSDKDLQEVVGRLEGTPVDPFLISDIRSRIEAAYQKRGYYRIEVSVDESELMETGVIYFRVREGNLLRVTDVRFRSVMGDLSYTSRQLRSAIRTEERGLLSRGFMDDDRLRDDVASLMTFYKDRGHLQANVSRRVREAPNGREAVVEFDILEGPRFTLRSVHALYRDARLQRRPADPTKEFFATRAEAQSAAQDGDEVFALGPGSWMVYRAGVFSAEQLAGRIAVKVGDVYSQGEITKARRAIIEAYHELGYVDAQVRLFERIVPQTTEVELVFEITEGSQFRTGEVLVIGNTHTKKDVILRDVTARPERPANPNALAESRRRLLGTRLFTNDADRPLRMQYQAEDPDNPGYRDVLIEVHESTTGTVNFGAALASDSGLIGNISVVERNFDITDYPESFDELLGLRAFRGAGQRASLDILPGSQVSTYAATFAEPRVFGSRYSFETEASFRQRIYSEYDEERIRGVIKVGRRFGSRWRVDAGLRGELVELSDLEPDAAVDYFQVQDRALVDGLSITLSRSSVDNPYVATRGNRVTFSAEQVGLLGGDYDFTKLTAEYDVYVPLVDDFLGRSTVLRLSSNVRYIPQNADRVPVYERWFLGGQNFRGFDVRGASPVGLRNDTLTPGSDPVGGTWSFFAGAEIRQPLYEDILAIVGFIDTGTVANDVGFDNYRVSVGIGIRLKVEYLSPAPIALDFGFPIIKQDTDQTRLLTFNVDVPFN